MRCRLAGFAQGLLLKIRSNLHCLRDHVNFSLTCSHMFRVYTRQYWKFACLSAGRGIGHLSLKKENRIRNNSNAYRQHRIWPWGGLARIVVEDAHFFRGPERKLETFDEHSAIYESMRYDTSQWKPRTVEEMGSTFDAMDWTPTHMIKTHGGKPGLRAWYIDGLTNASSEEPRREDLTKHPYLSNRLISQYPLSQLVVRDGLADPSDSTPPSSPSYLALLHEVQAQKEAEAAGDPPPERRND